MGGINLHLTGGNVVYLYAKDDHAAANYTVLNFVVPNIDAGVDALTKAGVHFEIYQDGILKTDDTGVFRQGGPLIAWFKDPAGNFLSVMEAK